jgi:hypothetical protein
MPLAALHPKLCWLAGSALGLAVALGCSGASGNRRPDDPANPEERVGQAKYRFPNRDLAAQSKAARAEPKKFEPVFAYAKGVMDFCLTTLLKPKCEDCDDDPPRYRPTSELDPHHWPLIEDALGMVDALLGDPGMVATQSEQLIAVKGRLLWLVGRSMEEQSLIDEYAHAHPEAVAVVRRRLEMLREANDVAGAESQCNRSRRKIKSAPEATQSELLVTCVALHPNNTEGKGEILDYAQYLPNLSPEEERLYRGVLVRRCEEKVGESSTSCEQGCACDAKTMSKPQLSTCKRACRDCRGEIAQKLRVCKKVGEIPAAPKPKAVASAKPKAAPKPRAAAPAAAKPRGGPAKKAKSAESDSGLQKAEL